jgi:hypothetical protein
LETLGIQVVAKDLGGHQGRKVIFNSSDGSVLMKRQRPMGKARLCWCKLLCHASIPLQLPFEFPVFLLTMMISLPSKAFSQKSNAGTGYAAFA